MIPRKLFDESVRWTVLLERIKAGQVKDMEAALDKAYRAFEKILRNAGSLDSLTRTEVEKLVTDGRKAFLAAELEQVTVHLEEMASVAGEAASTMEAMLESSAAPGFSPGVVQVEARRAMAQALRAPLETNGDLLEPFLRDASEREARRISNAARKAWSDGWTTDQAIARIKGTKSRRFQDGELAVSKRNMATAIRTSVSHVNSQAQTVFMAENDDLISGYRWTSTLDRSTSPICRSLDGRRFKLDDKSAPKPPAHPNCRSTMVPDLNEEFDWLSEGATRSSADGYVDQNETYYSWLKKQSPAYQDDVLGPARGKLLRESGLSANEFAALNLDKNFKPLTLAEMRAKRPEIFNSAEGSLPEKSPKASKPAPRSVSTTSLKAKDLRSKVDEALKGPSEASSTESFGDFQARAVALTKEINEKYSDVIEASAKYFDQNNGVWKPDTPAELKVRISERAVLLQEARQPPQKVVTQTLDKKAAVMKALEVPVEQRGTLKTTSKNLAEYPRVQQRVQEAIRNFESVVPKSVIDKLGTIKITVDPGRTRASYWGLFNEVTLGEDTDTSTILHEITHSLEYRVKGLAEKTKAFLLKRSNGQQPRPLRELTGKNYKDTEIAYEDSWSARGGSAYTGRVYKEASTEILTVGIERLFKDAALFANQDREFFDFVVESLKEL